MPDTHRRRNSTVDCRDPVYNSAANGIEEKHDMSRMTLHVACL